MMYDTSYQSSLASAKIYLETIQKYFLNGNGSAFPDDASDMLGINSPKLRSFMAHGHVLQVRDLLFLQAYNKEIDEDHIIMLKDSFFTSFEDFFTVALLSQANERIIDGYNAIGVPVMKPAMIGTLPIGHLNARVFKSPDQIDIITINTGLPSFLYSIAKVVAFSFEYLQTEVGFSLQFDLERFKNSKHFKVLSQDFLYTMSTYLIYGYVPDSLNNITDYRDSYNFRYIKTILKSALMFVVGHEYGHIHYQKIDIEMVAKNFNPDFNREQNIELDMDFMSILATMHANYEDEEMSLTMRYIGIEFYLVVCNFLDQILSVNAASTHPSSAERLIYIRGYIWELIPHQYAYCKTITKHNEDILYTLWDGIKHELTDEIHQIKSRQNKFQ